MQINKLGEDVYELKNFLNASELKEVYKVIDSTKEEDWTLQGNDPSDFWYGKNLEFAEENVFNVVNEKMKNLLESFHYYPSKMILQRYKIGDNIQPHRDQWIPDLPYYIGYGFCLYYNDDYEGGELEYPELGLKIKPSANSLYIHGGNVLHGSTPVLNDRVRYFSTVFVRGTEEEPTILKRELFK